MSGGSYNYLCWASSDDLSNRRGDIRAIAERLEKSGYYGAARKTREVLHLLSGAARVASSLTDIWHAVEWADSNDSSEDRVREAIMKFEPEGRQL